MTRETVTDRSVGSTTPIKHRKTGLPIIGVVTAQNFRFARRGVGSVRCTVTLLGTGVVQVGIAKMDLC